MTLEREKPIREESLWFGDPEKPLFGRLAVPTGGTARGSVLISPPIGRELRLSRRALRTLALRLALDGYVSLRFDHFGSGDSSGTLDDDEFDFAWMDGVVQGVSLLRSLGPTSVSAVGMRMGATIVGKAALEHDLELSSFVMWDPCESGRSYVRELDALGALQNDVRGVDTETSKMMEFPVSDKTAERLKTFSLMDGGRPLAQRCLVIVRDDRPVSKKFRERWNSSATTWSATAEQATLFENSLPYAVQPESTIEEIESWLTTPGSPPSAISEPSRALGTAVTTTSRAFPVRERLVNLGPNNLFGIVSEPLDDVQGPLIVMVNGVHEDHVGPARLWVELSRRWAASGLRCVRFDLRELGESPWMPGMVDRPVFDKTRSQDVADAVRALGPSPADSVLIGYCSGAQLALEVALELDSRGACAISPEVVASVFRSVDRVKYSRRGFIRALVWRVESFLKRHRWEGRVSRRFSHLVRSLAYPPRYGMALVKRHSEVLLLLGPEDLPRFPGIPILRRRLESTKHQRVEIISGMDHNLLGTQGRDRAVAALNQYLMETFVTKAPPSGANPNSTERSSR